MEVVKNNEQEEQVEEKEYSFMDKEKVESLKRKAEVIKDISVRSAKVQLQDPRTFTYAAAVCLYQGLKYKGSFGRGIRAGIATIGALVGANVAARIAQSVDEIKKA